MKTKSGHWYWVVFEGKMTCVKASPSNGGFFTVEKLGVQPWDQCEVIYNAWPPRPKKQSTYKEKGK